MLSTMRSSWLLVALACLIALSSAFSVEDLRIDGINAYLHHGERRQAQGTGVTSSAPPPSTSASPSPTPDDPTSTPDSSPSPSPTPEPSPSQQSSSQGNNNNNSPTPSTEPAAPSTQTSRADAPSTQTPTPSENNNSPSKTSAQRTSYSTKALISTELIPTTTVYQTVIDGSTRQVTSAGSRTVQHTTGSVVETSVSTVDSGSSSSGGLSSEKKAIIGGVIGGVGGAILLCGIAIVCWRMWGKKKRVTEDDADLMAGTGAALGDKSGQGHSPFQSNLEQYHNPGGRPNAAANF